MGPRSAFDEVGRALLLALGVVAIACKNTDSARSDDDGHRRARPVVAASFRELGDGADPFGVHPLTEAAAAGTWHWDLHSRDGVLVDAEHLTPSGHVYERRSYGRRGEGSVTSIADAHGEQVAVTVLAGDGTRTRTARSTVVGDHGCHHQKVSFDESGRLHRVACLDQLGRSVSDARGCEVTQSTYDADGQVTLDECMDASGKPALFGDGDHARRFTYDAEGRRASSESLDAALAPTTDAEGCARSRTTYDTSSSRVAVACLDAAGALVRESRFTIDSNGCDLREEKRDRAGALLAQDGVALHGWRRNELCDATHEEKRDAKGALTTDVPMLEYTYDARGWLKEERCSDAAGQPASCQYGKGTDGAKVVFTHDDLGRVTLRHAYTVDGVPSPSSSGYPQEFRYSYGVDGRLAGVAYFDDKGLPSIGVGVHRIAFVYDSVGAETSRQFFDGKGTSIATSTGCHEFRTLFDAHHLFAARECRDTAGSLHGLSSGLEGVYWLGAARVEVVRTPGEVLNVFSDTYGKELRRISCSSAKCYR